MKLGRGKKIFEGRLMKHSGGWDNRELNTVPSRDGRCMKLKIVTDLVNLVGQSRKR
jgi:hypothetical protein